MIEPNRPLYIMDPAFYYHDRDILARLLNGLRNMDYGKWTLAEEPYSDAQWDWVACEAGMSKEVDEIIYYLKCMEPATYYLRLDHGGMAETRQFCEFHKPRVRNEV